MLCSVFLFLFFFYSLTSADVVGVFLDKVHSSFCPFFAGIFLKHSQGHSAWLSADGRNVRTTTAAALTALRIKKCERNMGVDSVGMPTAACKRCYRAALHASAPPYAPFPPAPIPCYAVSPAFAPHPSSCADCAPSARKTQTLQGEVAALGHLLVLEHAPTDVLERQVAVAPSLSTPSALSASMSTGDDGENNRPPIVIQFPKALKAGDYWSEAH